MGKDGAAPSTIEMGVLVIALPKLVPLIARAPRTLPDVGKGPPVTVTEVMAGGAYEIVSREGGTVEGACTPPTNRVTG